MTIKLRRLVYISFILLFFIVSPIIILYTLGYKYNWSKKTLEKTGVFFIKSYPKSAEVYLNNKKYKDGTPTQINRLLPNNYLIKIAKEGYLDWQKNLTIYPDQTTFIEDVSLFKKNVKPILISDGEFSSYLQSNNKQWIILGKNETHFFSLWLFNINNEKLEELYRTESDTNLQIISWSNDDEKILLKDDGNYYALSVSEKNKLFPLNKVTKIFFDELIWDTYNDNILYGLIKNKLYQVDLLNNKCFPLLTEPVLKIINFKTDLLAIVKKNNKYLLQYIKNDKEPLLSLPFSDKYNFLNPNNDYLSLYDGETKILYLLEPENANQYIAAAINNVNDFQWHDDQFLYWNNNELWVDYPKSGQKILLERSSQPILKAFWHPNVVYVFNLSNDELKLYELDSRDQRNIYTLFNFAGASNNAAFINKEGDQLYLFTTINGQSGLYEMLIQ